MTWGLRKQQAGVITNIGYTTRVAIECAIARGESPDRIISQHGPIAYAAVCEYLEKVNLDVDIENPKSGNWGHG